MNETKLDEIILHAQLLAHRAQGASLYPANELIRIAQMIEDLARILQGQGKG